MRCDHQTFGDSIGAVVSIHTPTWGVTKDNLIDQTAYEFQSTHLHEVWQWFLWNSKALESFNPHTYMRCDCVRSISKSGGSVSIHTPTWGVTGIPCGYLRVSEVSIHTPTWGVTLCWITYYQPASLINYYANRYYFFDFTTQNCSINKLIYWFLTPAKLLFFL